MANIAASTKLGGGFGPIHHGGVKFCTVLFATSATGDVLIFDASNVGIENTFSSIKNAILLDGSGRVIATNTISSNQVTVGQPVGATSVTALVWGVGGST